MCWIAPNNAIVNSLFGSISGLGMSLITFDWVAISALGSPLVIPVRPINMPIVIHERSLQNVIVLGAAQHVGWFLDSDLADLSNSMGYVFRLVAFELIVILYYNQERVVLPIYAHI